MTHSLDTVAPNVGVRYLRSFGRKCVSSPTTSAISPPAGLDLFAGYALWDILPAVSDDKLFDRVGRVCAAGEILFRDGDPGDTMYVVRSGRIRVFKEIDGREKTLAFLGGGDFFGEMALLNQKPRTATAEVVEETRLLVIDAKMFGAMLMGNAEIAIRLIQRLATRLDQANGLIGVLMERDPAARIVLGVQRALQMGDPLEDGSVWLELDEAAMAQQVGVTAEEADSMRRRLIRLGLIEPQPDGVRIPDPGRLPEFLDFIRARASA